MGTRDRMVKFLFKSIIFEMTINFINFKLLKVYSGSFIIANCYYIRGNIIQEYETNGESQLDQSEKSFEKSNESFFVKKIN